MVFFLKYIHSNNCIVIYSRNYNFQIWPKISKIESSLSFNKEVYGWEGILSFSRLLTFYVNVMNYGYQLLTLGFRIPKRLWLTFTATYCIDVILQRNTRRYIFYFCRVTVLVYIQVFKFADWFLYKPFCSVDRSNALYFYPTAAFNVLINWLPGKLLSNKKSLTQSTYLK